MGEPLLDAPLFVGCVKDEAEMKVFGPFYDPVFAQLEATGNGSPGASGPCDNAHLIGRSVGSNTVVMFPCIPTAALYGEHGALVRAWHDRRDAVVPAYTAHRLHPEER